VCIFGITECKNIKKTVKDDGVTVLTNYGYIKGVNDSFAYMFLGIPFANPPTNSLRWQPPVAIKPWQEIKLF
jgi:carboxylesterase type B